LDYHPILLEVLEVCMVAAREAALAPPPSPVVA
jgi:hypothetical protein